MTSKKQFLEAIKRETATLEAIDAKRAELTKFHVEAIETLDKEIERLREVRSQHDAGINALEAPTMEARTASALKLRKYKQAVEHLLDEEKKARARYLISSLGRAAAPDLTGLMEFVGRQAGWRSYSDVKVRWVKHPTHTVLAVTNTDEHFRFYLAYDKAGKLVSALTSSGGGHRGAYVDVNVWGCQELVSTRNRYERVDGREVAIPYFCRPEGFREWQDSTRFAFSVEELSSSDVESLYKRLRINAEPLDFDAE